MPIHLLLAVLHLRIFLDTLGAAGMRRASRGAEERTWARGHSKTRSHSKQKRQDAQADDEDITRTRYEVRAEEEVRDNGRTGGPARSSGSTRCSAHGDGPALKCMAAGGGPAAKFAQAGGWIFFALPGQPHTRPGAAGWEGLNRARRPTAR